MNACSSRNFHCAGLSIEPSTFNRIVVLGFDGGFKLRCAGNKFTDVTLVTEGGGYDDAVVAQLKSVLGITVHEEFMEFQDYFERLEGLRGEGWYA